MGRSGPQITVKRQLLDCVTLTMVLLSLFFQPGKCRVLFQSVPLHSAACGAATLSRKKFLPNVVRMNLISLTNLESSSGAAWRISVVFCVLMRRKVAAEKSTPEWSPVASERPSLHPAAKLVEQRHFARYTGVFLSTFQPFEYETSLNTYPIIPQDWKFDKKKPLS